MSIRKIDGVTVDADTLDGENPAAFEDAGVAAALIAAHAAIAAAHHVKTPVTDGSYVGNASQNRAIPHGLGVVPKFVFFKDTTTGFGFVQNTKQIWDVGGGGSVEAITVTGWTSTNFYVGASSPGYTGNESGKTYYWAAI